MTCWSYTVNDDIVNLQRSIKCGLRRNLCGPWGICFTHAEPASISRLKNESFHIRTSVHSAKIDKAHNHQPVLYCGHGSVLIIIIGALKCIDHSYLGTGIYRSHLFGHWNFRSQLFGHWNALITTIWALKFIDHNYLGIGIYRSQVFGHWNL